MKRRVAVLFLLLATSIVCASVQALLTQRVVSFSTLWVRQDFIGRHEFNEATDDLFHIGFIVVTRVTSRFVFVRVKVESESMVGLFDFLDGCVGVNFHDVVQRWFAGCAQNE